jgi:hypothetical protein
MIFTQLAKKYSVSYGTKYFFEFVFCHLCGIIIKNLIISTNFRTHCARVSIQLRVNKEYYDISSHFN